MTEVEKRRLRDAMEKKILTLTTTIGELREATKPMGLDNSIGRVSRMDYINNKAVGEAQLLKAKNELKSLERWLSLYNTKQFGMCSRCGAEININRLLLMPGSTTCIQCAKKI